MTRISQQMANLPIKVSGWFRTLLLGLAIGGVFSVHAVAAPKPTKPQGPVNVEADRGAFDLKAKAHHFQGNVKVLQADFAVHADQVWVQGEPGSQNVKASGSPVRVEWPTEKLKATAQRVDYQQATGELKLSGNVQLDQNGNMLESEQIRYLFTTRTAIAEGGKRTVTGTGAASPAGTGRVHMRWNPEEPSAGTKKTTPESEEAAQKNKATDTP